MSTAAIVMFLFGAIFLWGGLALAIANYARAARRESGG